MVGIVASRRQRAHCCDCASVQAPRQQAPRQMCCPIVGRNMVGGMLTGALGIFLLVTSATATLAQSSAVGESKPAAKAAVAKGVPLPPAPRRLREASVTIPLPSPELLEPQSGPDCEIPPSDRLLGAIPETTRLIYERQCYKNAETVVRSKLQLLQDAIAGTVKALNDAGADQGVEPPDQHRKPTPSLRLPVNLASREGDVPNSSSSDAAVSGLARQEKTRGTRTPNMAAQSKPVMA